MHQKILEISNIASDLPKESTKELESGKVIFLPNQDFTLSAYEHFLFDEDILAPKKKNISYLSTTKKISNVHPKFKGTSIFSSLELVMERFVEHAKVLVTTLCPSYRQHLEIGRTSYRPAEIKNRKISCLKDDTRLHVDAFNSQPVRGKRILRVFSNVNPHNCPRVWNLGEPFEAVFERFHTTLKSYSPLKAYCLKMAKITKTKRTAYDHFMLELHDCMKRDELYQANVDKLRVEFPAKSSWVVFTDHVSHAALSGQYLFEQTFYLPVQGMTCPEISPLNYWQKSMPSLEML